MEPSEVKMKRSNRKTEESDDFELLDINEHLTGGKKGFSAYRMDETGFSEFGTDYGDILIVNTTRRHAPGKLTLYLADGRLSVRRAEANQLPVACAGTGLRLVAAFGKRIAPKCLAEPCGVITHIIKSL